MKKLFISGGEGGNDGGSQNRKNLKRSVVWRWAVIIASILAIVGVTAFSMSGQADAAKAKHQNPPPKAPGGPKGTVTVWIQVTDSCKQALSGATFTVASVAVPVVSITTAPTTGSTPKTVPNASSGCPTTQGTCVNFSTGCTSVVLNVPSSGTSTYTVTVKDTAPGHGSNKSYAICQGGSECGHGPEVATVSISSSGSVSATTLNHYPDGTTVTWGPFSGAQGNPILFHEFGIAANTNIQCDGDSDLDDFLTGTPGQHCDGDNDKKKH